MTVSDQQDSSTRLEEAVLEFLELTDRGVPFDREELVRRYPDVADELRSYFRVTDQLTEYCPGSVLDAPREGGADFSCSSSPKRPFVAAMPPMASIEHLVLDSLDAEFEILETIGRGGMGVVYKARRRGSNQLVAVKFLLPVHVADETGIGRFQQEAQALHRLHHPGIVTVHCTGEANGAPFIVMEFVEGRSLRDILQESPMSAASAARTVQNVATAVAEAHRCGILHRDLKPSNILIEDDGQTRVTDFGLAKVVDGEQDLTLTGQILGTPGYMAPEQADGGRHSGPASDIYALGAVLYATLTGRAPFHGSSTAETLKMVREDDPTPLRYDRPGIPKDLETICMKCLRKAPDHRYSTAENLAADLEQFLNSRPIAARTERLSSRLRRWVIRRPVPAAASAIACLFILTVFAGMSLHLRTINRLNHDLASRNQQLEVAQASVETSLQRESTALYRARQLSYASDMRLAMEAYQARDVRRVAELLDAHRPQDGEPDLRGFAWRYLVQAILAPAWQRASPQRSTYGASFSPDGSLCATCGSDGRIELLQPSNGRLIAGWDSGQVEVNGLAFHPSRPLLASAGDDGTVRLWSVPDGRPVTVLSVFESSQAYDAQFMSDGRRLVICGNPGTAEVWDIDSRERCGALTGAHTGDIESIAVSPDGRFIGTGGSDHTVVLWNAETLEELHVFHEHERPVRCVAFSRDSAEILAGSLGGRVCTWNTANGQLTGAFRRIDAIQRLAVLPSGMVAAADRGGAVSVWKRDDDPSGAYVLDAVWQVAEERIYGLAAHPQDNVLLTAARTGQTASWDFDQPDHDFVLDPGFDGCLPLPRCITFVDESQVMACADNQLLIWDIESKKSAVRLSGENPFNSCDHLPDENLTFILRGPCELHVWRSGEEVDSFQLQEIEGHVDEIMPIDRAGCILRSSGKRLHLLDLNSRRISEIPLASDAADLAHNDGLLWVGHAGTNDVVAWDLHREREVLRCSGHRNTIHGIKVSPDGSRVATTGSDRSVAVWDARTGELIWQLTAIPSAGSALQWSPDGRTIAAGAGDGTVRLIQSATGREMFTIVNSDADIVSMTFSPDGRSLVVADCHFRLHVVRVQ